MKSKAQQELEFTLKRDKQQIKQNRGFRGIVHRHELHKYNKDSLMTYQSANSSTYIPPKHKVYSRIHKNHTHKSLIKNIGVSVLNWLTTTKNSKKAQKKQHRTATNHRLNNHYVSHSQTPMNNDSANLASANSVNITTSLSQSPPSFLPNTINSSSPNINRNKSAQPLLSTNQAQKNGKSINTSKQRNKTKRVRKKKHRITLHSIFNTDLISIVKTILGCVIVVICVLFINETCNSIGDIAVKQKQNRAITQFNAQPILTTNQRASEKHKHDFIDTIAQGAKAQKKYKIAPSLIIAQAAQESSWGKSKLYTQDHNAFGVKGKYYGHFAYFVTQEDNGGIHNQLGMFKQYPNLTAGIADHNKLLYQNYLVGIPKNDYVADANALQKNGYATDPHYAQEIMSIVQENHLSRFD